MPAASAPGLSPSLRAALDQSREWGFLGEGPIEAHIAHALGFAAAAGSVGELDAGLRARPWMDLGSGGGIPGLVLADLWSDREAVLLDSNERRTRYLAEIVLEQGWSDRVRVLTARAESAGRTDGLRGAFSLVVARSFGSPPVTAECGAPFLALGGLLIVSEPPRSAPEADPGETRWPAEGLRPVGLADLGAWRGQFGYRILRQAQRCPDRFPRRVGVPGKRPIYLTDGV